MLGFIIDCLKRLPGLAGPTSSSLKNLVTAEDSGVACIIMVVYIK
jgi:hypothetical protein